MVTDAELIETVRRFYDLALEYGRAPEGRQGGLCGPSSTRTPLFANALYIDDDRGPEPVIERGDEIHCNVALQGNLTHGLRALSDLTGNPKYHEAALTAMRFFLKYYQNPVTGLLPWGGHMCVDLSNGFLTMMEAPWAHPRHELKAHFPDIVLMVEADREATIRFAEGFWQWHIRDDESLDFCRHADFFGYHEQMGYHRNHRKLDQTPGAGCPFMTSALDLCVFALFLYRETNDTSWLDKAQRMIRNYDKGRSPKTGLAKSSWARRTPTEAMDSHDISRYQFCAVACFRVAEELGKEGKPFLDTARGDLAAFARYGYDEGTRGIYVRRYLDTGERISYDKQDFREVTPYPLTSGPMERKNDSLPRLYHSYAVGWRTTGDEEIRAMLDRISGLLELDSDPSAAVQGAEAAACLIDGHLELAEMEGNARYLDLAKQVAAVAIERFVRPDGFIVDWPETRLSRLTGRLPLVLLKLAATLRGTPDLVEKDIGGRTYLDPDPKVRWRYERHWFRINGEGISAVVGDRYPHQDKLEGTWDRAGLQELTGELLPGNVFAAGLGGFVFGPAADINPKGCIVGNGDDAVLLDNGAYLESDAGKLPCLFRATYRARGPGIDVQARVRGVATDLKASAAKIRCSCAFAKGIQFEQVPGVPAFGGKCGDAHLFLGLLACPGRLEFMLEETAEGNRLTIVWRLTGAELASGTCRLHARISVGAQAQPVEAQYAEFREYATEQPDFLGDPNRRQLLMLINV